MNSIFSKRISNFTKKTKKHSAKSKVGSCIYYMIIYQLSNCWRFVLYTFIFNVVFIISFKTKYDIRFMTSTRCLQPNIYFADHFTKISYLHYKLISIDFYSLSSVLMHENIAGCLHCHLSVIT